MPFFGSKEIILVARLFAELNQNITEYLSQNCNKKSLIKEPLDVGTLERCFKRSRCGKYITKLMMQIFIVKDLTYMDLWRTTEICRKILFEES